MEAVKESPTVVGTPQVASRVLHVNVKMSFGVRSDAAMYFRLTGLRFSNTHYTNHTVSHR